MYICILSDNCASAPSTVSSWGQSQICEAKLEDLEVNSLEPLWGHFFFLCTKAPHRPALLFRAAFKWRLQENRFFLVFGLIIHFMATITKAKRCIFISRTPKCPGADEAGGAGRRYRLFSASLRSQFGPIWIVWGHGWWKLCKSCH